MKKKLLSSIHFFVIAAFCLAALTLPFLHFIAMETVYNHDIKGTLLLSSLFYLPMFVGLVNTVVSLYVILFPMKRKLLVRNILCFVIAAGGLVPTLFFHATIITRNLDFLIWNWYLPAATLPPVGRGSNREHRVRNTFP